MQTGRRVLMLVAGVPVDLASDFAGWPGRTMNVDVCRPRTDRLDQLSNFSSIQTLSSCPSGGGNVRADISCHYGARDCCRWRGTWLGSGWTISQVRAKKHGNASSSSTGAEMNMCLLHSAFEV